MKTKLILLLLGFACFAQAEEWFYFNPATSYTNIAAYYTNVFTGATSEYYQAYYIATDMMKTTVVTEVQTTPNKPFSDVRYAMNALVSTNASGAMSAYISKPNDARYALNAAVMTNASGTFALAVRGDIATSETVTNIVSSMTNGLATESYVDGATNECLQVDQQLLIAANTGVYIDPDGAVTNSYFSETLPFDLNVGGNTITNVNKYYFDTGSNTYITATPTSILFYVNGILKSTME